jgi:hypothetical protein
VEFDFNDDLMCVTLYLAKTLDAVVLERLYNELLEGVTQIRLEQLRCEV